MTQCKLLVRGVSKLEEIALTKSFQKMLLLTSFIDSSKMCLEG